MRFFRCPRYSLKALLVFTLVASLPCWYVSVKLARKRRERGAVTALRESGGWAWYDWEYSRSPELAKAPGPAWLRWVFGDDFFANVDVILITQECTEDVILRVLDELNEVQRIELSCGQVTEEMACRLERMKRLKLLTVYNTALAPERLAALVKALPGCNVFRSFQAIRELPSLLAERPGTWAERARRVRSSGRTAGAKTCHCQTTRASRPLAGASRDHGQSSRGDLRPALPPCCAAMPETAEADILAQASGRLARRAPGPCCCTAL